MSRLGLIVIAGVALCAVMVMVSPLLVLLGTLVYAIIRVF